MDQAIHPGAAVGKNTSVGFYTVIGEGAVVGDDCIIGNHVVIHGKSRIGNGVRIDDHAVIGKLPLAAARSKTTGGSRDLPPAVIGDGALIGTGAIIYAGASIGARALIADTASVREDCMIGELTIVGRNAMIENKVTGGSRCKIQADVYICAYSVIGDNCFIAPCVTTSNDNYAGRWKERTKYYKGVTVENGGRIAVNATILPGRTIGSDGMAAAGAVVTRDIPARTIAAGNPARKLPDVPNNQLLDNQEE